MMTDILLLIALLANLALTYVNFTEHRRRVKELWQHIEILEGDKRALTESLCRAQGKPYIRSEEKKDLIPSDGWFDGEVKVKVTPS